MEQFNDFICFRLGSLSRRIIRYYNNRFTDLGITLGQSFVLFSLLNHDGSSVKDIASGVQLDSPAVTGLVDRLIKEGLVERREDPDDRRSIQVYLTERGRQIANEAYTIAEAFNQHVARNEERGVLDQWEDRLQQLEHFHFKE